MSSLNDKVIIVTGGSNGIGAAIVEQFLQEGAKYVAILDIDEKTGKPLEHKLNVNQGCKAKFIKCDVTDENQLTAAFQDVIAETGYIDVVVNNAGIANESGTMYKKTIEVNFTALVTSTLKALELMRKDKGGKGGTIINVSSLGALHLICPSLFVYCATKAAVLHFTTSIGMQSYYEKTNVRMMCICFGLTNTDILGAAKSFDPEITEQMPEIINSYSIVPQSPNDAGKGVVEVFKQGVSASVWLIASSKPPRNITDNIKSAYELMSAD